MSLSPPPNYKPMTAVSIPPSYLVRSDYYYCTLAFELTLFVVVSLALFQGLVKSIKSLSDQAVERAEELDMDSADDLETEAGAMYNAQENEADEGRKDSEMGMVRWIHSFQSKLIAQMPYHGVALLMVLNYSMDDSFIYIYLALVVTQLVVHLGAFKHRFQGVRLAVELLTVAMFIYYFWAPQRLIVGSFTK